MPGLEFGSVGQDRPPTWLPEFDVEPYLALTDSDVAAINERFRRDRRACAAVQPVFLRASGNTLDHVGTQPCRLLSYVGERGCRRIAHARQAGSHTTNSTSGGS
jgi:hypothetical protein